jgi:tetratricopeptide (TPR) repeat protein
MVRLLASAAAIVVAATTGAPDAPTRALIESGRFKQARAILEPRVKADPSDAEAAALLARTRAAFGDLEAALPLAEAAVKLEPRVADYHWQLAAIVGEMAEHAGVFRQMGLARRFRAEAEAAIALDPAQVDAREGMMQYYLEAPALLGGDRNKANAMVEEIARLDPVRGLLARVDFLRQTKSPDDVEPLLRQAVEAARTPREKIAAINALVSAYLALRPPKLDAAEPQARALAALDPTGPSGYTALAIVYATGGRLDDLDAALTAAERAVPDNANAFFQAGRVLLARGGDMARAERCFRKYLTVEPEAGQPTLARAHWRLALVLEKEGRRREAIAELEQATRLEPDLDSAKKDLKRLRAS